MCAFPTAVPFVSCASGKKGECAALHHPLLPLGSRKSQKCVSSVLQEWHQRSAVQWRTRPPAARDVGKPARMEHIHQGGF